MQEIIFEDTPDLWNWLAYKSKMFSNSKVSDERFSKEIDKQMDNICEKLKNNKIVKKHGFILKVLNMY